MTNQTHKIFYLCIIIGFQIIIFYIISRDLYLVGSTEPSALANRLSVTSTSLSPSSTCALRARASSTAALNSPPAVNPSFSTEL